MRGKRGEERNSGEQDKRCNRSRERSEEEIRIEGKCHIGEKRRRPFSSYLDSTWCPL
jgi:hypothetical protein